MIKRFVHGKFEKSYKATIGADIFVAKFDILPGVNSILTIWDLAGQHHFRLITTTLDGYFKQARIVMLVYDITREWTFHAVKEWHKIAISKGLAPPDVVYLLVENKVDLEHLREVPPKAGEKLATELKVDGFIRTSALTGYNVEEAFKLAVKKLVQRILEKTKKSVEKN